MELSSTPGGFVGYVPIQEWYADWVSRIGSVDELFDAPTRLPSGLRISPETRADAAAVRAARRATTGST